MADNDMTLSGALTISDDALASIDAYELKLEELDKKIDDFVTKSTSKFKTFRKEFDAAMPNGQYNIQVDITGTALADLKQIAATIAKLNSVGIGGAGGGLNSGGGSGQMSASRFDETQVTLNQRITESLNKQAMTYSEITSRIKELTNAKREMDKLAANAPQGSALSAESTANLQLATQHIQNLQNRLQALGLAFDDVRAKAAMDFALNLPIGTVDEAQKKIEALKAAIEEYKKGGAAKDENARTQHFAQLNAELKRAQELYKQLAAQARATGNTTRNGAMSAADAARRMNDALNLSENNITEMREKLRSLQRTSSELRRALNYPIGGTPDLNRAGDEIDRLRHKMREAKGETLSFAETARNASRMLVGAFSVMQAFRFAKSIVDIYGKFQLMERSLGIIIDDANRAREIFTEIQQMAIKSPFQVTDLTSYAKQLAAFRFGVDELIPMTQKLADISAGLGVEMGRLILATGQVRAANYLKLTEVRQFTEAGVDLLGGLAERFSEIEGRAVTVGDVMQRITKRMVTFQDVDAVLTRFTSAGGTFYKMQEKQAETVFGLVSNLRDRWDLAMNQMGKDTDGMINGVIKLLIMVLDNAQVLSQVLQSAFWGYGISISIGFLVKGITSVGTAITHVKEGFALLKAGYPNMGMKSIAASATTLSVGLMAVVAAVSFLIIKLREAGKVQRDLNKILADHKKEASDLIHRYDMLTKKVNDNTKSLRERSDAMEALQAEFGKILPLEDASIHNLTNLNNAYSQHIQMIRAYVAAKALEAQQLRILEDLNKRAVKDTNNFADALKNTVAINLGFERGVDIDPESVVNDLKTIFNNISQEILSGNEDWINTLEQGKDAVRSKVKDILSQYFDHQFYDFQMDVFDVNALYAVKDAYDQISKLGTQHFGYISFDSKELEDEIAKIKKLYQEYLEEIQLAPKAGDNPAADIISAQDFLDNLEKEFKEKIENGNFSDEVKKQLTKKLNSAIATVRISDESIAGVLLDLFNKINRAMPGLEKPMGTRETEYSNQNLTEYTNAVRKAREQVVADIAAIEKAQKDVKAGTENASSKLALAVENAAIKDIEKAKAQVRAYDILLAVLADYDESLDKTGKAGKGAGGTASELAANLKSLAKELAEYYDAMGEVDAEELAQRWEKLTILSKKTNVPLPDKDNLTKESLNKWIDEIFTPRTTVLEIIPDFKIKISDVDRNRLIAKFDDEVKSIKQKIDLNKKFADLGIEMPEIQLPDFYAQLKELTDEYVKIGTKEATDKANEVTDYLRTIYDEATMDTLKMIANSNQKASEGINKLFGEYYSKLQKIDTAESGIGKTSEGIEIDPDGVNSAKAAALQSLFAGINKELYNSFKGSELYIRAFGDLDNVAVPVLEQMKAQLQNIKDGQKDLNATDAKALSTTLDKIDQAIALRGNTTYSYLHTVVQGIKETMEAYQKAEALFQDTKNASQKLVEERNKLTAMQADPNANADEVKDQVDKVAKAQDEYNKSLEAYSSATADATNKQKAYRSTIKAMQSTISGVGTAIDGAVDAVFDFADAFGITISPEAEAALESLSKGFSLVASAVSVANAAVTVFEVLLKVTKLESQALMTTLWPLLVIALALSAALAVVNAADKKKEVQIEKQKKKVEELQKQYDSLIDSMNEAMSVNLLLQYNKELKTNIDLQRQALTLAIQTENSRGNKKDENSLEQMNEDLAELDKRAKEVQESFYENLGVDLDFRGLASDFASSWLDAFRETGNGLGALRKEFDEYFDSILIEQFALRSIAPLLDQFESQVKAWLADGELDPTEMAAYRALRDTMSQAVDSAATSLAETLGVAGASGDSVETSELQKGIQALTENTGQALESLLNSVRFYVAELYNASQKTLSYLDSGESPLMGELKAQTATMRSIEYALSSVIRPGHRLDGGQGIRVFMD